MTKQEWNTVSIFSQTVGELKYSHECNICLYSTLGHGLMYVIYTQDKSFLHKLKKKLSLSSIHDLKFHRHFDRNDVNFIQTCDSLSTTCVLHVYCRIGQRSSCQHSNTLL